MAAAQFAEVIGSPYAVWVAPIGTAFPTVDSAPAAGWVEFGTNGTENQGTKGVTLGISETISSFKPAGDTLKVKDWRTEEDVTVAFSVVDTTVEQLSQILDGATITTVAASTAVAGNKSIHLKRGVNVAYFALLVRGLSPYDDGTNTMNAQWEFARVCQEGNQSIVYVPGTPAEVDCQFGVRGSIATDPSTYRAMTSAHL